MPPSTNKPVLITGAATPLGHEVCRTLLAAGREVVALIDETDTESEQEDREDTENDHSIRPVTEREQEDRDEIESDQFIQASPHDSGWVIG